MKFLSVVIMLFLPITAFSQIEGVVLDKETKRPIPYVNIWIEDEDAGTTSNVDGIFKFNDSCLSKKIILSAIGYEKETVELISSNLKIYLTPVDYLINEVVIKPNKNKQTVIGHYKKSDVKRFYSPNTPRICARLFKKDSSLNNSQFIKSIKIITFSKINSIINLRFFNVDANGDPGGDYLKTNFPVKIRGGIPRISDIDLSVLKIEIPDSGLFVAIEYFIIEENLYVFHIRDSTTNKITEGKGYMPALGELKTDTSGSWWEYSNGRWNNQDHNYNGGNFKNHCLAIELTLID